MKKFTCFVVALCCTMFLTAKADYYEGQCGDNLYWTMDTDTGVLEITGSGDMWDFQSYDDVPWGNYYYYITTVHLPKDLTSIGSYAFYYSSKITSINLPDGITYIGNEAFSYCSGLTSITIPENVQEIGERVFVGCNGLKTVIWNAKNAKSTVDGSYYTPEIFHYEVARQITSFTFGNAVEAIPDYICCEMIQLPSITLPNSVTSIGRAAFCNCENLQVVTIPKNVESIGGSAFASNKNLQIVNFLGNKLKTIGYYAFNYCPALKSIDLPEGVESLGNGVFEECTFSSIVIPKSVNSIGEGVFSVNKNLKSVTISNPDAICEGNLFDNCGSLETLIVPASALHIDITRIDYMPSHLQSITVTGGELTESAFDFITHSYRTIKSLDCGAATNTALSDEAFKGCYNLQSLILPQSLTYISYMAVAGCKNLKSVDIPASVEEIEQSAFEDCRSMETLTFGGKMPANQQGRLLAAASSSKLRRIGNWAFYNAHELQHLEIPEGVEEIGDAAFYGCTYLQDMELPSTVKKIGDNCFALCSKLEKITVKAVTPPTIYARTFYDVSRKIPVFVPEGTETSYLDDPYWHEMNIQGAAMGFDEISNDKMRKCENAKIMREGVLYILRDGELYSTQGARVE